MNNCMRRNNSTKCLGKCLNTKIQKFTLDLFRKVNINDYTVNVDIEKAFDSLPHIFARCLKKSWHNNSTD